MNEQYPDYALSHQGFFLSKRCDTLNSEIRSLRERVDNLTDLCIALSAYVGKINGLDVRNLEERLDRVRK